MQCIASASLKQLRPAQLQAAMMRNGSGLCCSVLDKRLNNNKPLPLVKKVHKESFEAPNYVTKSDFIDSLMLQRMKSMFNEFTGLAPTLMQKRFLVLTRLFRNRTQIPDYVASNTINRMHDRLRVVFIIVATSIFYVFFFAFYRTMAYMVSWNKRRNNFIHLHE